MPSNALDANGLLAHGDPLRRSGALPRAQAPLPAAVQSSALSGPRPIRSRSAGPRSCVRAPTWRSSPRARSSIDRCSPRNRPNTRARAWQRDLRSNHSVRLGDDCRVHAKDQPCRHRTRRSVDLRIRGRNRRPDVGRAVRAPGRSNQTRSSARLPRWCTPRCSKSASCREHPTCSTRSAPLSGTESPNGAQRPRRTRGCLLDALDLA